ncbi:MAG: hypothetical protein K1X47_15630, partial [Cyclobacteriaceae bacterium]|nr:hypothetical protein [Cyclobacteriaceae bacterium]
TLRWCALGVIFCAFSFPVLAQNTKGDRPINNERQIRETRVKSYKRKEKAKTRDIAGRRLRTKDKSSASRANASFPRVSPYRDRPRVTSDRAAKPRGRVFSSRPRERQKAWRGDIAGARIRRIRPSRSDASKANIYPQYNEFVNNPARRPRQERPVRYTRNVSGKRIVKRQPQRRDHSWRQSELPPRGFQSATGTVKNVYPSNASFVHNPSRRPSRRDQPISNRRTLAQAAAFRSPPPDKPQSANGIRSLVPSFLIRGKKNVYWGKFSKGERAALTDPAGNPVRTRNFKSAPIGLVARDTLKFFGKKPLGDKGTARTSTGVRTATRRGQVAWNGDLAGNRLRNGRRSVIQRVGEFFFPRKMSASGSFTRAGRGTPRGGGRVGKLGYQPAGSRSGAQWNNNGNPLAPRTGGKGMARAARYSGTAEFFGKNFNLSGLGYAGNRKGQRPTKGRRSVSGKLWNNRGQAVSDFSVGSGSLRGSLFGGNRKVRRTGKGKMGAFPVQSDGYTIMGQQGIGYRGDLQGGKAYERKGLSFAGTFRRARTGKGGGSKSGRLWNNGGQSVSDFRVGDGSVRAARYSGNTLGFGGFSSKGLGFAGNFKTRRPPRGGGSVSGRLWNNKGLSTTEAIAGDGTVRASKYSGNMLGFGGFSSRGLGFAGNLRTRRPAKGGGSVSGRLWNNKGLSTSEFRAGDGTVRASKYSGNMLGFGGFSPNGLGFAGNLKTRRPAKGGGSVSGRIWNNRGQAISDFTAGDGTIRASRYTGNVLGFGDFSQQGAGYAGNIRTRRPKTGGGSVSFRLHNNNGQSTSDFKASRSASLAARFTGNIQAGTTFSHNGYGYAGHIRTRRPRMGGGSVSGKPMNNQFLPIPVANAGKGRREGTFQGNIRAGRPWKGGGSVSGKLWNNEEKPIDGRKPTLMDAQMVRFTYKEKKSPLERAYVQNPNASRLSILKRHPDATTYRVAGLQIKVRERNYVRKPYAADIALKGVAPGRRSAKAAEYMHVMKRYWSYRHNPNAADEALDAVAPVKIMGRIGDYQGNFKMHKYTDRRFHPDSQFAHGFRDNVKEERTILMNVKLFWSKLFRKNDTQPENLKEKIRRPRYDKREQGLWYE